MLAVKAVDWLEKTLALHDICIDDSVHTRLAAMSPEDRAATLAAMSPEDRAATLAAIEEKEAREKRREIERAAAATALAAMSPEDRAAALAAIEEKKAFVAAESKKMYGMPAWPKLTLEFNDKFGTSLELDEFRATYESSISVTGSQTKK